MRTLEENRITTELEELVPTTKATAWTGPFSTRETQKYLLSCPGGLEASTADQSSQDASFKAKCHNIHIHSFCINNIYDNKIGHTC
jgi:hypothetical protein